MLLAQRTTAEILLAVRTTVVFRRSNQASRKHNSISQQARDDGKEKCILTISLIHVKILHYVHRIGSAVRCATVEHLNDAVTLMIEGDNPNAQSEK
jgi:hypothetical protein